MTTTTLTPKVQGVSKPRNSKRDLTVEQLAQLCLAEAGNHHARAITLANKYARGARSLAVLHEICWLVHETSAAAGADDEEAGS